MALVSIVVPVYYNAASLPTLAERLAALAMSRPEHRFEFIFVDDGSRDASYTVLESLAQQDGRLRLVKLTRNFGSNAAILAGMSYARGHCVAFVAADLQDPPETLVDMLSRWEAGAKVVLAARRDRHGDPWTTRLSATAFNWLFSKLAFPAVSPSGIGFFLVDRQVRNTVLRCNEKNANLIGLLLWTGYPYVLVSYTRIAREHGRSRWTLRRKLNYSADTIIAFSYLPLRIATALGVLLAALGALYALFIILLRLHNNVPVPGWSALMVILLLVSGAQLSILGILGEYLWRSLDASRNRPIFVVDRVVDNQEVQSRG